MKQGEEYQFGNELEEKRAVKQVIAKYPEKVEEYKAGKVGIVDFFSGKVLNLVKGADIENVKKYVLEALNKKSSNS